MIKKEVDIQNIIQLVKNQKIVWTSHVLTRLIQRNILQVDVENAIINGRIIEQYPDDYPNPSCLVLGLTSNQKHLHIVCGISDDYVWIITAYEPDSKKWNSDFSQRI